MKRQNRRWTPAEIEYLTNNTNMSQQDIAKNLARTVDSIRRKRLELDIRSRHYKKRLVFKYQRHTEQCGGIDPVVIDRIVSAGTIEQFAQQHPVCDCERAYILKYVPEGSTILLWPKPEVRERLNAINV